MSLGLTSLAEDVAPADRLDTLPAWPWDILDDSAPRTLGWAAIAWAEGWTGYPDLIDGWFGLTQPNGPRARLPFRLTTRQKRFLLWFYALDDDAQWVYDSAERRLPKGSGKSPFAGVHALIEFLGPVRLATFRRGAPGGVEGRPVDMPLVQITATAESQTKNTMRYVRAFAPKRSHVVEFYQIDWGKMIFYGIGERTLEVTTSSAASAEGAEASFVVKDELEEWVPANNGPDLAATIDDNLAKSGNRSLGTCNAWVPGRQSVAENDWDAWVLQEEGRTQGETRQLYDAIIANPETDMAVGASLTPALEDLYDDCDWKKPHEPDPDHPGDLRPVPGAKADIRPIRRRIWDPKSRPDDSERKYLNRPVAAEDAWHTKEAWQILTDPEREVVKGERIALGFDGSKSRDATALIGCCISDGHTFVPFGETIWEPDPAHNTVSVVNVHDVDRLVERTFDTYNVLGFFGDVVEWESFVKLEWPRRYGEKLKVKANDSAKDPQTIAWDMRNRTYDFTVACELTHDEITNGDFTHDGNPALGRHVVNARNRPNRWGMGIGKESPSSPRKIDATVAMIIARLVRRLVLVELAKIPEQRSKVVGRM